MEAPQQQVETTVIRSASQGERENGDNEDECGENVPVPDPGKDDMMARRTGSFQKASTAKTNQFLPVPGSVKYNISPVSAMKLHSRPKLTEKEGERYLMKRNRGTCELLQLTKKFYWQGLRFNDVYFTSSSTNISMFPG